MMNIETLQLPIIKQKTIAEKTCEVSFDLFGKEFNFLAGQYIRVSIPKLLYSDPKGASRVFSIASSPNNKDKISIAFRDSGIRQAVENLDEPIWYIVGLPAMVADMRNLISRLGINDSKIYFEDFIGY